MNDICVKCSGMIDPKDKVCPHCGARLIQSHAVQEFAPRKKDKPLEPYSLLWVLIGFVSPVVGFILYLIFKNERPISASNALKGAFVSIVLSVIVFMFFFTMVILQPGAPTYNT